MHHVFRLMHPVLDRNMYILKVMYSKKRATYESNIVFDSALSIFNVYSDGTLHCRAGSNKEMGCVKEERELTRDY